LLKFYFRQEYLSREMSHNFRQTLLNYVVTNSRAGDIQSIINAIDK